jgi:hypothetical protein
MQKKRIKLNFVSAQGGVLCCIIIFKKFNLNKVVFTSVLFVHHVRALLLFRIF